MKQKKALSPVNQRLRVKSGVRAGSLTANHNRGLLIRSGLRAGALTDNHNRAQLHG
jgi:hypothetical protein